MPFVVVITAVVIVNNGDDNAWCFVSVLSFVVLPKHGLLAEELLQQGRDTFLTLRTPLCYCDPLRLNLKVKMKTQDPKFIFL